MAVNDPNSPQTHLAVRYDLILADWLRETAEVLQEGSLRHGDNSWQTLTLDDQINHIMAHMQQYREGDTSERHIINMTCRLMFLYWFDKQAKIQQATQTGHTEQPDSMPDDSKPRVFLHTRYHCSECLGVLHMDSQGGLVCDNQPCSRNRLRLKSEYLSKYYSGAAE